MIEVEFANCGCFPDGFSSPALSLPPARFPAAVVAAAAPAAPAPGAPPALAEFRLAPEVPCRPLTSNEREKTRRKLVTWSFRFVSTDDVRRVQIVGETSSSELSFGAENVARAGEQSPQSVVECLIERFPARLNGQSDRRRSETAVQVEQFAQSAVLLIGIVEVLDRVVQRLKQIFGTRGEFGVFLQMTKRSIVSERERQNDVPARRQRDSADDLRRRRKSRSCRT